MHAFGLGGGNMEARKSASAWSSPRLFAVITTAASCGAGHAMHGSFTALGGLIPLINMQLGEVIVGGVGAGFYGIVLFVIIAIFVAGLMVGRTPEYLGKKIEAKEMKMAILAILCLPTAMLIFTAIACVLPTACRLHRHCGSTWLLRDLVRLHLDCREQRLGLRRSVGQYALYNITLGISLLMGRFLVIIPALAIAGSLVTKKRVPSSAGTFPTDGPLSSACSSARSLSSAASPSSRLLALGPVVDTGHDRRPDLLRPVR